MLRRTAGLLTEPHLQNHRIFIGPYQVVDNFTVWILKRAGDGKMTYVARLINDLTGHIFMYYPERHWDTGAEATHNARQAAFLFKVKPEVFNADYVRTINQAPLKDGLSMVQESLFDLDVVEHQEGSSE